MTLNNAILRSFILGYNSGMVTFVSQAVGLGQEEDAARALNRTLVSSSWYMLILGGFMAFMQQVLLWMGVHPDIASVTALYNLITYPGMFVWMYYDSFRQYLNSWGLFYLHFPVTTIAFLFAILASYIFT